MTHNTATAIANVIRVLGGWFVVSVLQAAPEDSVTTQLFQVSFDDGLGSPVKIEKIELAPGVRGQGVHIPADGVLDYPAEGNISAEKGTASLWVKLDWSPIGTGTFADRPVWNEPGWTKWIHTLFSAGGRLNPNLLSLEPTRFVENKIRAGDWHHFAVTWDAAGQTMDYYLDGLPATPSRTNKYTAPKLAKELSLGSATSSQLGLGGTLDEARFYDRVLTTTEIGRLHTEIFPVQPVMLDHAGIAGNADEFFRIRFVNITDAAQRKDYAVTILGGGKELLQKAFSIDAKPGETILEMLRFAPPAPGDYEAHFEVDGLRQTTSILTAVSPAGVTDAMPPSATGETKRILLTEIDCTQELPEDVYRDDGNCHVATSACGSYRETTLPKQGAGFAYRFQVQHPGRPHWLEIEYPDDAERCFSLAVYNCIEKPYPRVYTGGGLDTVGIITGGNHPLTHQAQTKRLLLWPDGAELLVGCWTFRPKERGAAASKLRLYENDGPLPKLELNYPEDAPRRTVDIWNEDPTMEATNWFNRPECYPANDSTFWLTKAERMVQYLRFVGRSSWSFLLFDYEGDNSGTLSHCLPFGCGWPCRIPGYSDLIATVFDREEIPFFIELNHRVTQTGALGQTIGPEAFAADFADAAARGTDAIEAFTARDSLAGGLNPLHPRVQAAYLKIFHAYAEKFGRYREFRGIHNISPWQVWFDDAETGYSDYCVGLFEKETGIDVPVPDGAPERFSKRYAWFRANAWEKWISWRCEKVRDFHARLLAELNADGRSGKQLVIRLLPQPKENPVMAALAAGGKAPSLATFYREGGVDLDMLGEIDGLIVVPTVEPNMEIHPRQVDSRYFYFSPEFAEAFESNRHPAVLIQQHSNLEVYPTIARNQYIQSFWWPVGGCVYNENTAGHYSTPLPDNAYVLEHMTWALAELDPWFLDHGWWGCPENGDYADYQRFYQAFLSIPRLPFAKADGPADPVTVRVHNSERGHWFYAVNKASYPVKVSFDLGGGETFSREFKGHELVVLQRPGRIDVSRIVQELPTAEMGRITALMAEWERKLALCKTIYGTAPPSATAIVAAARAYLDAGEFTRAERRLESASLHDMAKELRGELQRSLSPDGDLVLRFTNTETRPVSGKLSLDKWPTDRGWVPEQTAFEFTDLAPGAAFIGVFRFAMPEFHGQLNFESCLELDGKAPLVSTFAVIPFLALKCDRPATVDADLSDWDGVTTWYDLPLNEEQAKKPGLKLKPCSAKYAWRWDETGLALAVKVDEEDFIPPDTPGHLYRADSLQIYFDQLDNKSRSYDGNDLVYQLGLLESKPVAWREQVPEGLAPGFTGDVRVAVRREGGTTFYEAFFPASEFTRTKLKSGGMLGFSVMVNNLDSHGPGRDVHSNLNVNPHASPYLNPWSWRDLLLVDGPISCLRAGLEGTIPLQPRGDNLERAHWLKDKPEESERNLQFNSKNLTPDWQPLSFEFVPTADGQVKLSLAGSWTQDGNRLPECGVRNIRVAGAEARPLDNWSHYDLPEVCREDGVLEIEVDMRHPVFTQFQVTKDRPVKVDLEVRNTHPARHPEDLALVDFFRGLYQLPQESPARFALNRIAHRNSWRAFNLLRDDWPGNDADRNQARETLKALKTDIERGLKWPYPAPPRCEIPRGTISAIDGKLDDPAWEHALTLRGDVPVDSSVQPQDAAVWKLLWDENKLYVGAFVPDRTPQSREPVYHGDSVEIFVMPSARLQKYWEVIVGRDNTVFDGLHVINKWGTFINGPEDTMAGLETKAAEAEGGYIIEAALPFRELPNYMLGNPPKSGETLHFALVRTDKDDSEAPATFHSAFPLLYGGHNVFGHARGILK